MKRTYNSARRQESALLTRQAIAQAALNLFNLRGYWGASIDAIAEAAAVAPETIYASFGSKRELLHYLLDVTIGGDEAPVRLIDRPEIQAILHETDARHLLERFSNNIPRILSRAAPVYAILAEAGKTEPELAALLNRVREERLENMRKIALALGRAAPLRESETQAAETLWAITSPELFSQLTEVRGWSHKQYSAWLQDSLSRLLLQQDHN